MNSNCGRYIEELRICRNKIPLQMSQTSLDCFEKSELLRCDFIKYQNKIHRNIHPEVFCEKGVLKTFAKLTGKHLC